MRRILGSAYLGSVVPDSPEVLAILGMAHLRQGEGEAAIADFRQALARNPNLAAANRNLGRALSFVGRPEAIDYLTRAVQLDPDDADSQYELGRMLLERRQWAEAADHLRVAVRSDASSAVAHNDLGTALASMGDMAEAVKQFTQAVALQPDFAEARQNLAAAMQFKRGTP